MPFGKKPPEPPSPPAADRVDAAPSHPPLPWAGWVDEIGCNFAGAHLVQNLQVPLTVDGRVHAETLIAAAGALAGWGAHRSFVASTEALTRAERDKQVTIATMKDGRRLLFGDAINAMLVSNSPATAPLCVWNYLAGTAIGHGLAERDLPDLGGMFSHVSKQLGGAREGFPSTPDEHQPHLAAGQLLDRVRPLGLACLTGEISEITKKQGFFANETSWQAVTAWSAGKILAQCCSVLAPGIGLVIGMESAIYASKLIAPSPPQLQT